MEFPNVRRPLAAALLAAGLALCQGLAARAAEPPASVQSKVSLAGLDLSTEAGRQQARERASRAARRLCRQLVDTRVVESQQALFDCVSDAMARLAPELAGPVRVARSR